MTNKDNFFGIFYKVWYNFDKAERKEFLIMPLILIQFYMGN
jgi:hypothetical protein